MKKYIPALLITLFAVWSFAGSFPIVKVPNSYTGKPDMTLDGSAIYNAISTGRGNVSYLNMTGFARQARYLNLSSKVASGGTGGGDITTAHFNAFSTATQGKLDLKLDKTRHTAYSTARQAEINTHVGLTSTAHGGIPASSSSVTGMTVYGAAGAVGTASTYSKGDHKHAQVAFPNHSATTNRSRANSHPTSAITGLDAALAAKLETSTFNAYTSLHTGATGGGLDPAVFIAYTSIGREQEGVASALVVSHNALGSAHSGHFTNTSNPHSVTAAQVGAPTLAAFGGYTSATNYALEGRKVKHGFVRDHTVIPSFDNTTHVFTLTPTTHFEYYYLGNEVIVNAAKTVDLDTYTLSTGLWYITFDDTSGNLVASKTAWNMYTQVPIATIFWNSSAGAVGDEMHLDTRDVNWHYWAHRTIGARYYSGFAMTDPIVGTGSTISVGGGTIYDEDIEHTIATPTTSVRVWYQTGASTWSFQDPATTPYITSVSYAKSDSAYTLTDVANNQYINSWFYASGDIDKPIYMVIETRTSTYATLATARAATPPDLSSFEGNQELKILYRIIWKGDNIVQEITDYRTSSPLPSGGAAATSAAAVTYSAGTSTTPLTAATVQGAIDELDLNSYNLRTAFSGYTTIGREQEGVAASLIASHNTATASHDSHFVANTAPHTGANGHAILRTQATFGSLSTANIFADGLINGVKSITIIDATLSPGKSVSINPELLNMVGSDGTAGISSVASQYELYAGKKSAVSPWLDPNGASFVQYHYKDDFSEGGSTFNLSSYYSQEGSRASFKTYSGWEVGVQAKERLILSNRGVTIPGNLSDGSTSTAVTTIVEHPGSATPYGSHPPAGSNKQVQYNLNGAAAGASLLNYTGGMTRIGDATMTPTSPLHVVRGNSTTDENYVARISNAYYLAGNKASIAFTGKDKPGNEYIGGNIGVVFNNHSTPRLNTTLHFNNNSTARTGTGSPNLKTSYLVEYYHGGGSGLGSMWEKNLVSYLQNNGVQGWLIRNTSSSSAVTGNILYTAPGATGLPGYGTTTGGTGIAFYSGGSFANQFTFATYSSKAAFYSGSTGASQKNILTMDNRNKRVGIGGVTSPSSSLDVIGLPVYGGATMTAARATITGLTRGAFWEYSTAGLRQLGVY